MNKIYNYTYSLQLNIQPLSWAYATDKEIKELVSDFTSPVNIIIGYNRNLDEGIYNTAVDLYIGNQYQSLYKTNYMNFTPSNNLVMIVRDRIGKRVINGIGRDEIDVTKQSEYAKLVSLYDKTNYQGDYDQYPIYPYSAVTFYNLTNEKTTISYMSGEAEAVIDGALHIPHSSLGKFSIYNKLSKPLPQYMDIPADTNSIYIVGGTNTSTTLQVFDGKYYKTTIGNIIEKITRPITSIYTVPVSGEGTDHVSLVINPLFTDGIYSDPKPDIKYYKSIITVDNYLEENNNDSSAEIRSSEIIILLIIVLIIIVLMALILSAVMLSRRSRLY